MPNKVLTFFAMAALVFFATDFGICPGGQCSR